MNGNMLGRIAIAILFSSIAHAQQPDQSNAATWYSKAIERWKSLPQEQRDMLMNVDEAGPTAEQRALVSELGGVIELVRRGSSQQFSDFGLDHTQGISLLLPHLSELRSLARLINLDARIRLESGDSSGAAEALATMYRMSDHVSDDRVAISSLVGQAIFTISDQTVQQALDEGKLNAGDAMTLLKASSRFSPSDPFAYAEAVMMEQEMVISSVEDMLLAENGEQTPADLAEMVGGPVPFEVATMSKEDLRIDLGRLDLLMDRVVETFLIEDRERGEFELKELEKELESGEHGFFAKLMLPAIGKLYERMVESEEKLGSRIKSLKEIASGEVTPGEAANAALWYLSGIEELEKMPEEKRAQYRAIAAKPAPIEESVARDLQNAKQAYGIFLQGSQLKRCDFTFARDSQPRLQRMYVAGMRDAAKFLHADALRVAQQKDMSGAVERLAVCFRMSKHLGDDQSLLASLAAHEIFATTAALSTELLADSTTDSQKETLLDAVARTSRKDPFGYIGAIVSDRALALQWLYDMGASEPAQDEGNTDPSPRKVVNSWDADHLLSVLMLLDWLRFPPAKEAADPALDFSMLSDVVSLDEVGRVHLAAQSIHATQPEHPTAESRSAMAEAALALELPAVAPVRERIGAARQVVRDLYRKLRTVEPESAAQADEDSSPPSE